jgi:hypothetical protein
MWWRLMVGLAGWDRVLRIWVEEARAKTQALTQEQEENQEEQT